jgi:hypothetical protein
MDRDAFEREPAVLEPVESPSRDERKQDIPGREVSYRLSGEDLRTLRTVAIFRTVEVQDLARKQTANLLRNGLIERKTVQAGRQKRPMQILIATRAGKDLLEAGRALEDPQRFHSGLVKPNELAHDAAIYPAYLEQAAAIEKAGGRVRRVLLDYELKSVVNRQMNRKDGPAREERRAQIAKDLDLEAVDGKLPLPDLRIEYTDQQGHERHLDVEITNRHYRGAHLAGKSKTGFRLMHKDHLGVNRDRPGGVPKDDHRLGFI